jgi:hypothetical protein
MLPLPGAFSLSTRRRAGGDGAVFMKKTSTFPPLPTGADRPLAVFPTAENGTRGDKNLSKDSQEGNL